MSAPPTAKGAPIERRDQLVQSLADGCKPRSDWRIGTEHEKFVYTVDGHRPVPYAAPEGQPGIENLLEGIARYGWQRVEENGHVIALKGRHGCNVSLEPGGQLELSGAPVRTLHETCREVNQHLSQVKQVAQPLGVGMLGMGFTPDWRRDEMPWMPKQRYEVMGNYMPKVGTLGLDMMLRTCTVQVNLDFADEADMVKKMRVGLALQPVATALFANSPFTEGKPNGFLSYRSHIWTDTDPDRCGMLPFVFDEGFGFERYVDYVLDVPMYFVFRDGVFHDVAGKSFRDFLNGKLEGFEGEVPHMSDWSDHLTTLFPEVRLKSYIEMRGADGGPWHVLCALPAFWVGLLYNSSALDAAWDLMKGWTVEELQELRAQVPRHGLKAQVGGTRVLDLARETLEIADHGLATRNNTDGIFGQDERQFLTPLKRIVDSGETWAEEKLRHYHGKWNQSVDPIYRRYSY
ncbi:glutamate--cysteine ligase [Rhodovibrio salinarum]|uniref:Glutamate--cysteine ligase n=1 Tax=Rhodovibrio salinarum TaxID=1087 RepID=A0A934UZR0_9PROT|nr:glutamate--cysteine ligase [Rhodovibrio salinarum]MBK1696776.1 glutamate--cysteine ligase [Rhodovibrio salinarum]